jgi:hypothetical protein
MPYIITIRTMGAAERAAHCEPILIASRTAVATLEDARSEACRIITRFPSTDDVLAYFDTAEHLPASGDTLGPLPDGTVIEVRRVEYAELRNALDEYGRRYFDDAQTLAAFNDA